MSGFCKAIASRATAFQALDSTLCSMHFKQRFVVAEEGIRSNGSFLCISNDYTAVQPQNTLPRELFFVEPSTQYAVRRELLPLRILQVGYTVSAK